MTDRGTLGKEAIFANIEREIEAARAFGIPEDDLRRIKFFSLADAILRGQIQKRDVDTEIPNEAFIAVLLDLLDGLEWFHPRVAAYHENYVAAFWQEVKKEFGLDFLGLAMAWFYARISEKEVLAHRPELSPRLYGFCTSAVTLRHGLYAMHIEDEGPAEPFGFVAHGILDRSLYSITAAWSSVDRRKLPQEIKLALSMARAFLFQRCDTVGVDDPLILVQRVFPQYPDGV